jgi:hypothetical protein
MGYVLESEVRHSKRQYSHRKYASLAIVSRMGYVLESEVRRAPLTRTPLPLPPSPLTLPPRP